MLKRSEHIARAMLLGMKYMERLGYYFKFTPSNTVIRIDAFTLEPLSERERKRRMKERYEMGSSEKYRPWYNE